LEHNTIVMFRFSCTVTEQIATLPVSGGPQEQTQETANNRTLWAVRSTGLILIEAPSSAYRRGMLALGKQPREEEETS
jgi:hypothetical protein